MPRQTQHQLPSYAEVDITDELARRPSSAPASARLRASRLVALTQQIAEDPAGALQALVDMACHLTGAHGSGVSVSESDDDDAVFRWVATSGALAAYRGGTLPRWFSPCGDVLRKNALTLMREPVRHYRYAAALPVAMHELLLAPFRLGGRPVGTVWVVSTDPEKRFDAEDGATLVELADFVNDSTSLLGRLGWLLPPPATGPAHPP